MIPNVKPVEVDGEMIHYDKLPFFARIPLRDHIEYGRDLGSAFTLILENSLRAILAADYDTLYSLQDIYRWLINYAPSGCWGSVEKVSNWKAKRRFEIGEKI